MEKYLQSPFAGIRGDKCFGCSPSNQNGLHLQFAEDGGLGCAEADADYYVMDEVRSRAMGFTEGPWG